MKHDLYLHLFLNISKLIEDQLREELDAVGIFQGQGRVLAELFKNDGMTQINIAKTLGISPATVTNMLKRMELNGFIKRYNDKHDDRVIRVYLTKDGNKAAEKVLHVCGKLDSFIQNLFHKDELESIKGSLSKIKAGFDSSDTVAYRK